MPSLKDLRNRIASVKATQKITKAMQMVAAAKLRRAQEAAEAARPYSQRMAAVLANIAAGGRRHRRGRRRLMTGTGRDDVHLLVVCTAERGLCGGFNSSIARLARDHARRCWPTARTVKILMRRQEGLRHPAPRLRRADHRLIDLRGVRTAGLCQCRRDRPQGHPLFNEGQFDVCTLVLFASSSR